MLDNPMQLLVVGALVLVFIMWGPKKIPELARALGQAKAEFSAGAADKPVTLDTLASKFTSFESAPAASPPGQSDAKLMETAQKLGISTDGKTPQQISEAIVARLR